MKVRKAVLPILIAVFLLAGIASVSARPIVLKIGSPTPKGSPWDNAIRSLAMEWSDITDGQVQMKIYSGGVAGDEADMIRKMNFNSLQGGVFTSLGLNMMYPDVVALSAPFIMANDEEFNYVFDNVEDELRENIENQGFKVAAWTSIGWLYIFSKEKVVTVDDWRALNLATTDTDDSIVQGLKNMGFNAIPIGLDEVITSLTSNLVESCYTVKMGAAAYQWFGIANHMTDMPMAPVLAGIVLSKRAWDRIPDMYKEDMLDAAQDVADQLVEETEALEREAMRIMIRNGLIIHEVPADAAPQWENEFREGFKAIAGQTFSEEFYDRMIQLVEEYRN